MHHANEAPEEKRRTKFKNAPNQTQSSSMLERACGSPCTMLGLVVLTLVLLGRCPHLSSQTSGYATRDAGVAIAAIPSDLEPVRDEKEMQPQKPFLCSLTRVRNEHKKFESFVRHHRREGFDKMLFLDDRSSPPLESTDPRAVIRRVDLGGVDDDSGSARQMSIVTGHMQEELTDCIWVAYIDIDEFVTTRRNETASVRDEIARSFPDEVSVVHVPWVMYGNDLTEEGARARVIHDVPLEVLWRWNHSMHHEGGDRKTRDRFDEIGA